MPAWAAMFAKPLAAAAAGNASAAAEATITHAHRRRTPHLLPPAAGRLREEPDPHASAIIPLVAGPDPPRGRSKPPGSPPRRQSGRLARPPGSVGAAIRVGQRPCTRSLRT